MGTLFIKFKGSNMKIINIASLVVISSSILLGSCATPFAQGTLYSGGTYGLAANNNVQPLKTGKACVHSWFTLVSGGDGSIERAKANGHITKVASVNYDSFNVLGFYGSYCTVVKGE